MPLMSIATSAKIRNKEDLLEKSSQLISELTDKSKKFIMVKLNDCLNIYFADDHSPSCFVEIKSIGSIEPNIMASKITKFLSKEIGIPSDRIYINFNDVSASMWAWNGSTFA